MALEILDLAFGVGNDGVTAGGPVGWANFSVLISELEGLHKSQSLVNRPEKLIVNRIVFTEINSSTTCLQLVEIRDVLHIFRYVF